jgi:ADP-heptose:LPS heptosyltransferase
VKPLPADLLSDGRELTVLVIRFGALGDVLRTLPAVRLVRRGLPAARILWCVDDRWAAMLDGHPDLAGLVPFPRRDWNAITRSPAGWLRLPGAVADWRSRLRRTAPELVLDFHGNLRSGLTAWLSGAPVRLGHAGHQQKEGNRLFTTHRAPAGDRRTPRIERNLDLVRALGLEVDPLPDAGLPVAEDARREAGSIGGERYAIIAPGVSRRQAYKKPPTGLLAEAARRLAAARIDPLVVFGPGEEEDARAVVEAAGGCARLAPPTSLPLLLALLADARLFVGGDTGPMHMACAVGCPVVALYGPTDPQVNAPWGVPHAALSPPNRVYTGIKREDRTRGFEGLSEETVGNAVERLLPANG